jgi:hypothetical protein
MTKKKHLVVLSQTLAEKWQLGHDTVPETDTMAAAPADDKNHGEYGGKGEFKLPSNHKAGVIVPKGGSCCANCEYFYKEKGELRCGNKYWIKWNGGDDKLPVDDPETYCSDFWEHGK